VTEHNRLQYADPLAWPVHPSWQSLVNRFWLSQQGLALLAFLQQRLQAGAQIYPPEPLRALCLSPLSDVKVVILGQDPYHGMGQAEGLAFSVPLGVAAPPSLRNIFKELHRDIGQAPPFEASLSPWAANGVLLLNTCLTVEDGLPASHTKQGWEALTDAIIHAIAESSQACVFMLWGAHAQSKAILIAQTTKHKPSTCLVLQANHPSPLSALRGHQPFIGCGHFSKASMWLQSKGLSMDWRLES
jgi:uracil-DNA glycosylase